MTRKRPLRRVAHIATTAVAAVLLAACTSVGGPPAEVPREATGKTARSASPSVTTGSPSPGRRAPSSAGAVSPGTDRSPGGQPGSSAPRRNVEKDTGREEREGTVEKTDRSVGGVQQDQEREEPVPEAPVDAQETPIASGDPLPQESLMTKPPQCPPEGCQ